MSSRHPMPCAAAHSVVRSFRNILPPLSPRHSTSRSSSLCSTLYRRTYATSKGYEPTSGGCYAINPWFPRAFSKGRVLLRLLFTGKEKREVDDPCATAREFLTIQLFEGSRADRGSRCTRDKESEGEREGESTWLERLVSFERIFVARLTRGSSG